MMDHTDECIWCLVIGWVMGIVMIFLVIGATNGSTSKEYKEYSKLRDYCENNMQVITLNTDNKIMECK